MGQVEKSTSVETTVKIYRVRDEHVVIQEVTGILSCWLLNLSSTNMSTTKANAMISQLRINSHCKYLLALIDISEVMTEWNK